MGVVGAYIIAYITMAVAVWVSVFVGVLALTDLSVQTGFIWANMAVVTVNLIAIIVNTLRMLS